tara:strand:+ start:251 stop:799 length:549 start_codon:yes stop_codon:yes gene_type:complete
VLKAKIRKKILKIRRSKSSEGANIKFKKIYNLIKNIGNLKKKIVGGYYPVNYEMDDLQILKEFEKKKIKIALPLIKKNFKMKFIQCSLNDPFIVNRYGIPEPNYGKVVYPDILLIPLVAFDKNLNRLGYGAGFYDRIIKSLKNTKNIITIGLAFDFQEVYSIPVSIYDQKLDFVVTNKKILR